MSNKTPATRTFEFKTTTGLAIPEIVRKSGRNEAVMLPFQAKFTEQLDAALKGEQPHFFVPHAFWKQRNAEASKPIDPKKIDDGYARGKLRDQWNKWLKQDAEGPRKGLVLLIVPRSGKEGIEGIEEAGVSVWMDKAK